MHLLNPLSAGRLCVVVLAVIAGASVFFFCKLGWLLFMAPPDIDIQAQLTETLFWIPVVYLLSFILEEGRVGQWIVRAFTAAPSSSRRAIIFSTAARSSSPGGAGSDSSSSGSHTGPIVGRSGLRRVSEPSGVSGFDTLCPDGPRSP